MNLHTLPATIAIEGEILNDAVIDPRDMASMNFARDEFDKLEKLLWPALDQFMARNETGLGCEIARHLEQIRIFSGNFCWRHRHLGNMHNATKAGGDV